MLFYRPHEIEGATRADWRVEMPKGENITCKPPSRAFLIWKWVNGSHRVELFVCCCVYFKGVCEGLHDSRDAGEIISTKVYASGNLRELEELYHGSWQWRCIRRWSLPLLSNPLMEANVVGTTELVYSIEDVLNDEMVQNGDTIALPPGGNLKSVFFSEDGVFFWTMLT
jgi:hypothetical protein